MRGSRDLVGKLKQFEAGSSASQRAALGGDVITQKLGITHEQAQQHLRERIGESEAQGTPMTIVTITTMAMTC